MHCLCTHDLANFDFDNITKASGSEAISCGMPVEGYRRSGDSLRSAESERIVPALGPRPRWGGGGLL
jgi:hypothetical protein